MKIRNPMHAEEMHFIDFLFNLCLYFMQRKVIKQEYMLLFVRIRFQQFFSHIEVVSGCDRELNAHFYSAASLKFHAPDT